MRCTKRDFINIVISFVVMLFIWWIYRLMEEAFPSIYFVVVFLLVLIFLEVTDLQKKK